MTLWLSLGGCVQTVRFPPDLWRWEETGFWWDSGGPRNRGDDDDGRNIQVESVRYGCDAGKTTWVAEMQTDGWIHQAKLNVFRTADGVSEEHPFTNVASAPLGEWDQYRVSVTQGVPAAEQVAGESSQFDCDDVGYRVTWVVRIWDGSMTLLDCVAWGADTGAAVAALRGLDPDVNELGCRIADEDMLEIY